MLRPRTLRHKISHYAGITLGCLIASCSINLFLVPSHLLTGGATGIAIIFYYLAGLPIGIQTLLYNIPLLLASWKLMGRKYTVDIIIGTVIFSLCLDATKFLNAYLPVDDLMLAAIFGGIITGTGVGLIIRNGGSLDGTEIIAIICDKKTSFSVGEVVMFFNLFILGTAGFVFGWDKAMYSLVAYFVISKMIDIVIKGLDESYAVMIVSDHNEEIADALMHRLGRGVTYLHGHGGYTGEYKQVLYCVVTRLEVEKLKLIALEKDDSAFVTINPVHDIVGGRFKKKSIH